MRLRCLVLIGVIYMPLVVQSINFRVSHVTRNVLAEAIFYDVKGLIHEMQWCAFIHANRDGVEGSYYLIHSADGRYRIAGQGYIACGLVRQFFLALEHLYQTARDRPALFMQEGIP